MKINKNILSLTTSELTSVLTSLSHVVMSSMESKTEYQEVLQINLNEGKITLEAINDSKSSKAVKTTLNNSLLSELTKDEKEVIKSCLWNCNLTSHNSEIFEITFSALLSYHSVDSLTVKTIDNISYVQCMNERFNVLVIEW